MNLKLRGLAPAGLLLAFASVSPATAQSVSCDGIAAWQASTIYQPGNRLVFEGRLYEAVREKNTDALIGGVAKVLADEGIQLGDSTRLLKPLLAEEGTLTRRKPDGDEMRDIGYGRRVANALSGFDIGQSVAIAERACVAVEAMEGTDAMLERAAALVNGKPLRLVKASRRRKHLQFDVPVAGPGTVEAMKRTGTTALAIDAGRTLLLDKTEMLEIANAAGIAILGVKPEE